MTATNQQLGGDCHALIEVNEQFQGWLEDHADQVRQEKAGLDKELRRTTAQLRRLDRALQRPMCAGVFGPSQSGKSYLISALARRGTAPLMASFGEREVDFIREINPAGGRESTGLVTRFSIHPMPTLPEAPVQMRLLTQTDIVKILGNTYYADCNHDDAEPPAQAEIESLLETLAAAARPAPVDPLTADDVYDLQTYFERYFKGQARIRVLRHGFWQRAAELAPRLAIRDRARLFGILWDNIEPFDRLYIELYGALQRLDFAPEAGAGLEALVPRETSIIDVLLLVGEDINNRL